MSIASIPRRSQLIRKALDCVILLAPEGTAPITSITTGSGATLVDFATVHAAYKSLGRHTKDDGLTWGRDIENSDVMSHGSVEPVRRDITSDIVTLAVSLQESRRENFELVHNIDLSAVTATAVTGEVGFNRSSQTATRYSRVLAISQDGFGADTIYFARFLPRAIVSEVAEQSWSDTEEIRYGITWTGTVDDELGYSMREMWGGPGWQDGMYIDAGFPALAAEVQSLSTTGTVSGGTFTLTFDGQTTAAIPYNANAAAVQSALLALSNLDTGDVVCTGGALPATPVVVTFGGEYAGINVPMMTADDDLLTGTSPVLVVATTTEGASA